MSFNELNAVKCAIPSLGMRLQNLTKFPLIPLVRRVGGGGVGVGWGWGGDGETRVNKAYIVVRLIYINCEHTKVAIQQQSFKEKFLTSLLS